MGEEVISAINLVRVRTSASVDFSTAYGIIKIMGSKDKLLKKAKNNPKGLRFDELCNLAENFGFVKSGGKGSHVVYTRKGIAEILTFQDAKGEAKPYQVRQFLKILDDNKLEV